MNFIGNKKILHCLAHWPKLDLRPGEQNALRVSSKTGKEIMYIPILAVEPSATHTKGAAGRGAITELGKYRLLNTVFSWLF